MKKLFCFVAFAMFASRVAVGATVVATVGSTPITDTDITARANLMSRMGKTSTDNRRVALQEIIDDNVKLTYAQNFNVSPSDADVDKELKRVNLDGASASVRAAARSAMRADIAWQIIVARTVLPTISISDEDIAAARAGLAREHGLPVEMTIVRLVDIPDDVASKLKKPKNCDDAMKMATDLGGNPQKFTALHYELSDDIRTRLADLPRLTWSPRVDGSVFLICASKKTREYGDLDNAIKQNAMFKRAMFVADQQLKQLRRKAVVVIHDDRYKL